MTETTSHSHQLLNTVKDTTLTGWTDSYRKGIKRIGDLVLCIVILPTVTLVISIMYLLVRFEGGPGFFGHQRIGKNGKTFKCWKMRTMAPDSQERLTQLLNNDSIARAEWERDCKLQNDPRVTRLGDFLRRSSLDELPQIWNVLKGEMSLIGPRPVTEPELAKYGPQKWAYLAMRPGITGLWQVSGRNDVSYDERVKLDVTYYQKASFIFDTGILCRTVGTVLARTGV